MADPKLCSIPDCRKPAPTNRRGWCMAHYTRWRRHGDPLGGGTASGEVERYFREVVVPFVGHECLVWPYNRTDNGYGQIRNGGRQQNVHRLVCIEVHGAPPTMKHEAAHSCGNGHLGCVNPMHLSWKTRTENMADKLLHGTHNRGRSKKLTPDDVRQIRRLKSDNRVGAIALRYGVSHSTVSNILSGKNWGWLEGGD